MVRSRRPWLKTWLIRWVIRQFKVDLAEAASTDLNSYPNLNSFFVRNLRAGARPLAEDEQALLAPADGVVSEFGTITDGRLVQAKGQDFSLIDLLAGDSSLADLFQQGEFCTVYLSPKDYHRVHMPIAGQLQQMIHVPGRLFSVQAATARAVPSLYARNERVVALFDTAAGPVAMILVGAIFVSSIETTWHGVVNPHGERSPLWQVDYPVIGPRSVELDRGAEMGRFNMGSTVIVLGSRGSIKWRDNLVSNTGVKMGEALGNWCEPR
ncbi:MAG: phosphatidylserine decarboxylase [Immundisolibacteraceae bacterium]|nr:phosphatidylserine decarboxylase [Immundisolibacteraceae bacterium]